jgi:hypothetical protein
MSRQSHARRIASSLATVLVVAGLAAPVASARPALEGPPPDALSSQPAATHTVIERVKDNSFDIGDAAIGAGAGAGLILVALGGIAAASHARPRLSH